jgi:hypothetical protein
MELSRLFFGADRDTAETSNVGRWSFGSKQACPRRGLQGNNCYPVDHHRGRRPADTPSGKPDRKPFRCHLTQAEIINNTGDTRTDIADIHALPDRLTNDIGGAHQALFNNRSLDVSTVSRSAPWCTR